MIVVDASAIMAMVLDEADSDGFRSAILRTPAPLVSAGTLLELDLVSLRRGGEAMRAIMEEIIAAAEFLVVPVQSENLRQARLGYQRFGKGRGAPPSALNYGDCFSYGLAKAENAPLLFKGDDFTNTDVEVAAVQ